MLKKDNVIKIYSTSAIPANKIVELLSYNEDKQAWLVRIPTTNTISFNKLVVTRNILHNNGSYRGLGQYGDGFYTIETNDKMSAGQTIGSLGTSSSDGVFLILHADNYHAICRPILSGGSGGGTEAAVYKLLDVVYDDPTYGDYLQVKKCYPNKIEGYSLYWPEEYWSPNLIAYPHPQTQASFYDELSDKLFFGKTIDGFLVLDIQPWSVY